MPSDAVVTAYRAALPDDPDVKQKQMFGSPCAFVNRQMFFGTFEDSLVARVGPRRVTALAGQPGMQVFSPSEGKVWDDYVQLSPSTPPQVLAELAAEAMRWAAALPKKAKPPKRRKR